MMRRTQSRVCFGIYFGRASGLLSQRCRRTSQVCVPPQSPYGDMLGPSPATGVDALSLTVGFWPTSNDLNALCTYVGFIEAPGHRDALIFTARHRETSGAVRRRARIPRSTLGSNLEHADSLVYGTSSVENAGERSGSPIDGARPYRDLVATYHRERGLSSARDGVRLNASPGTFHQYIKHLSS